MLRCGWGTIFESYLEIRSAKSHQMEGFENKLCISNFTIICANTNTQHAILFMTNFQKFRLVIQEATGLDSTYRKLLYSIMFYFRVQRFNDMVGNNLFVYILFVLFQNFEFLCQTCNMQLSYFRILHGCQKRNKTFSRHTSWM